MKTFAPITVSVSLALLSSSALAASHDGVSTPRHRRGPASPQWIKRRANIEKRQDASVFPIGGASLLVVAPANASAPTNSSSASSTTSTPVSYNGQALWFNEAGNMGACGTYSTDEDLVVGLSSEFWPDTTVISPFCGQYLNITYPTTGKSIVALIADAAGKNYTTLTKAAFKSFAPLEIGQLDVIFSFLNATSLANSTSASNSSAPASSSSSKLDAGKFNAIAPIQTPVAAVATASISSAPVVAVAVPTKAPATPTVDLAAAASASAKSVADEAAAAASSSSAAQAAASASSAKKLAASNAAASQSAAAAAASSKSAADKVAEDAASSASAAAAAATSKAAAAAASASSAAADALAEASKTAGALLGQVTKAAGSAIQTFTGGYATYYFQNGVAGACGKVNPESAVIIAIDSAKYDNGANCGRSITLCRTDVANKCVTAIVADECPTCENGTSLDLSEGAFDQIATKAEGMVPMSWHFNN